MSDIVRYLAFFSYFSIQLAQLFLCCFADRSPLGKPVLEKVGKNECFPLPSQTCMIQLTGNKTNTKERAKETILWVLIFVVKTLLPFGGNDVIHLWLHASFMPNSSGFLCQECE